MKRYWFPLTLILLFAGFVAFLFATNHFARYFGAIIVGLLVVWVLLLWYMFRRGVGWKRKLGLLAASVVLPLIFFGVFRVEGFSGAGYPQFVLRSSSAIGSNLAEVEATRGENTGEKSVSSADTADLLYNFGGPERNNMLATRAFGTDWEAEPPRELWRREIGTGWGSFAIAGDRIYTLEQRGSNEWTTCYELLTGEPVWGVSREARFFEGMSGAGPRSTPFVEGDRLFALGCEGDLTCLSVADGSTIWERNMVGENGNLLYGKACTPLRVGDLVVVSGAKRGGTLLAFNADTGEPVWAVGDKEEESRYASPRLATFDGREMILSLNQNSLTGHDPVTGQESLRIDWPGKIFPRSSQPMVLPGDRLFATASYGMNSFVAKILPNPSTLAAAPTFVSEDVWRRNRMKNKFSSTQVYKGHAYGLDEGIFCCVDLENGDKIWKGGRYGYGQNLLIEDVVLVQCERGDVVLVAPDPTEHRELARLDGALTYKTWNAPSIAGRFLLVRNGREAACYELPARK